MTSGEVVPAIIQTQFNPASTAFKFVAMHLFPSLSFLICKAGFRESHLPFLVPQTLSLLGASSGCPRRAPGFAQLASR